MVYNLLTGHIQPTFVGVSYNPWILSSSRTSQYLQTQDALSWVKRPYDPFGKVVALSGGEIWSWNSGAEKKRNQWGIPVYQILDSYKIGQPLNFWGILGFWGYQDGISSADLAMTLRVHGNRWIGRLDKVSTFISWTFGWVRILYPKNPWTPPMEGWMNVCSRGVFGSSKKLGYWGVRMLSVYQGLIVPYPSRDLYRFVLWSKYSQFKRHVSLWDELLYHRLWGFSTVFVWIPPNGSVLANLATWGDRFTAQPPEVSLCDDAGKNSDMDSPHKFSDKTSPSETLHLLGAFGLSSWTTNQNPWGFFGWKKWVFP